MLFKCKNKHSLVTIIKDKETKLQRQKKRVIYSRFISNFFIAKRKKERKRYIYQLQKKKKKKKKQKKMKTMPSFSSTNQTKKLSSSQAWTVLKKLECEREEEAYQMMKINLTSLLGFAIGLMACFTPRLLRLKQKKPIICHSIAC